MRFGLIRNSCYANLSKASLMHHIERGKKATSVLFWLTLTKKKVGERFFGAFWCSTTMLKHQATIIDFLAQRIREVDARKITW